MRDLFTNEGATTVSSGGTTAPAQGTTESWTVASSASFPAAVTSTSQFYIADPALPTEIILVTNVSGTTWSVTRGASGTTPVAHTTGFTVNNVVPSTWLQKVEDRTLLDGYLAADVTGITSTTYLLITGLTATVPAAGKYRIRAHVMYAATTLGTSPTVCFAIGGATSNVNGPGGNMIVYSVITQTNATSGAAVTTCYSGYKPSGTTATPASTGNMGVVIDGYCDLSASGTVSVQVKVSGTLSVFAIRTGSSFVLEPVG